MSSSVLNSLDEPTTTVLNWAQNSASLPALGYPCRLHNRDLPLAGQGDSDQVVEGEVLPQPRNRTSPLDLVSVVAALSLRRELDDIVCNLVAERMMDDPAPAHLTLATFVFTTAYPQKANVLVYGEGRPAARLDIEKAAAEDPVLRHNLGGRHVCEESRKK